MNEKQFLEELIAYNLENLKHIEFAPNADFELNITGEGSNDILSKLVNKKEADNEFY
jgi:hypothetical protein